MIPDDLITKAVGIKTILRFSDEDGWANVIAQGIYDERMAERKRSKNVVNELLTEIKLLKLAVVRYGDRKRMSNAEPIELQKIIDEAIRGTS